MPSSDPFRPDRDYSPLDRLLIRLHTRLAPPQPVDRERPGAALDDAAMEERQRRHVAGLMRVNHAGEIAAQALYHGQAMVARRPQLREQLLKAGGEERAHLEWCAARLDELGESTSLLAPLWYAGSFAIGATAGLAGDGVSLGFVEETERQVIEHLDEHLQQLPEQDRRSRAILETMRADEARHGREAHEAGAQPLPAPARGLMTLVAKVMKFGAYRF